MKDFIVDDITGLIYNKTKIDNNMKDLKVAFVIGHTDGNKKVKDKGAYSHLLKRAEWNYWNDIAKANPDVFENVFHHDGNITSYTQRQKDMSRRTKDFDLVIELHFNSSAPQANGVESLTYFYNKTMDDVGEFFCNYVSSEMGIKNRGNKKVTSGNGFGFLEEMVGDAILLEPFFGSNQGDVDKFNKSMFVDIVQKTVDCYKLLKNK